MSKNKFQIDDQVVLSVCLNNVNWPVMGVGYYDSNDQVVCFYINKNLEIVEHAFPEELLMSAMDLHFSNKVGVL